MEVAANDEINIDEVPKSIPTDLAIAVNIGDVAEPHHSNEAVMTKPITMFSTNSRESRQPPSLHGKAQRPNRQMVKRGFLARLRPWRLLKE